jgi:hypothetical protein
LDVSRSISSNLNGLCVLAGEWFGSIRLLLLLGSTFFILLVTLLSFLLRLILLVNDLDVEDNILLEGVV